MTRALTEKLDPEAPILEAVRAGDQGAYDEFVRRQAKWVRGVIYGVLGDPDRVDDVSQQVWSSVWTQICTLKEPHRWRSWLYRLARNAAMDAGRESTRRRKLARALKEQMSRAGSRTGCSPAHRMLDDEQRQALIGALRELPALYREPFVLRHLEGWSYRQIAEVFDMPLDTVETRLVRARRQLREALRDRI